MKLLLVLFGLGYIRKISTGYVVMSHKGKKLGGPYKSRKEAVKRLQQVEYWKRKRG